MNKDLIYVNDVNFNNGILELVTRKSMNQVLLKSKDLSFKYEVKNNKVDIKALILSNKMFFQDNALYELQCVDNTPQIIFVDCAPVVGKEYLCKDYQIDFESSRFYVDIYINNLNRVKIKISKSKELYQTSTENLLENIQIDKDKLIFSLKINLTDMEEHNGFCFEERLPKEVKFYLYDKKLGNSLVINPVSVSDYTFKFEANIATCLKEEVDELFLLLALDGERADYKLKQRMKFKKFVFDADANIRFGEVLINNDGLSIKSISKFKINPIISKIVESNGVLFTGDLNYDYNFIQSQLYHLNVIIVSKDKKMEIVKEIVIRGGHFEFNLDESEIISMKEYSPDIWTIYLEIKKENEIQRYRMKFKDHLKKSLLSKSFLLPNQIINFRAYLTKEKNALVLQAKNSITITKILYISRKNNTLEIKYRTKENIESLLDNKQITTTICNGSEELKEKSFKKIGKQTFISYYKCKNFDQFIEEAKRKGLKISVTSNDDKCFSDIKELDLDTIYSNEWEKFQRNKKYKKLCDILYNKLFLKMPIKKNRIMFESFLGRNVSGNPKYLYHQLVEDELDQQYELIWILNNLDEEIEGKGKKVKRKSLMYYYYMATSKYWIFNCRQGDEIKKRKENIYLQTWHGTPLKKLGMDMDNVNMAGQTDINDYKRKFYNNSRRWDYLLAQNDYSREIFKRAFSFDKAILSGYPANDILYQRNNAQDIEKIKDKLGIPKNKKVILYAPTWRDDNFYKKGHYRMTIQLELDKMQEALGDEYVILLRMHYLITNNLNLDKYSGFVYNYSQGYDIQELYLVSDILITDYSSVMFDYANLKRPIIFFTYDIEQYRDSLRGFYFDFEKEAPGPLVVDTEGVIQSIISLDKIDDEYAVKKEAFYNKFCHIDNGNAATNILKEILK